ncbi:MAG: HAMP domain-containing sensor histidine kinase [Planctomycetota bacterium]
MTKPSQPDTHPPSAAGSLAGAGALLAQVARLEEELAGLGDRLARAERLAALGSLAAVVAHEVNNVLTPVTSYAQLALDAPDDTALTRKALTHAVEGVARAERITASVLELTREAQPKTDDDASDTRLATSKPSDGALVSDLRETVASAVSCLPTSSRGVGAIDVRVDVADVRVAMAGAELYRVLVNLLLNAKRAVLAQTGARTIAVTARIAEPAMRDDGDGDGASWVEIDVADSGPGVPSAVRDRLFEPFTTCPLTASLNDTPDTSRGGCNDGDAADAGGSGLGLSICRELVERAGGTICVEPASASREGGAVFRVRLPVAG